MAHLGPVDAAYPDYLHELAGKMLKVERNENREKARRVFDNTMRAESYKPPNLQDVVDKETLLGRRENYNPYDELPERILFLTAGGDVQSNRIEVEVVGHGLNGETWGCGYFVISGSPERASTWKKVDEVLRRTWQQGNRELRIAATCIDARYKDKQVMNFTRQRLKRRVYAIQGSAVVGKATISKPKRVGKPPTRVYELGTNEIKHIIYQNIDVSKAEEAAEFPHGYCHWPKIDDYDLGYFKQLTCEQMSWKKGPDGEQHPFFDNVHQERNEAIDCRVYAIAARMILKPNWRAIAAKRRSAA